VLRHAAGKEDQKDFADLFLRHLLSRNIRIERRSKNAWRESSCCLANFGKQGKPEPVLPKGSQETLAEIVGTTRSRVNFFMNRFRKSLCEKTVRRPLPHGHGSYCSDSAHRRQ
jgi:hypothetical protein